MKTNLMKALLLRAVIQALASVKTDNGELYYDGELEVGKEVAVMDGEDSKAAPDGDYKTEDGKTITVKDGKITEIKEPETTEEPAEQQLSAQELRKQHVTLLSQSYNELQKKIYDAVIAAGFTWPWIVDFGENYAVANVYDEDAETYKDLRFEITIAEDGSVTASNPVEVYPKYLTSEEAAQLQLSEQEEIDKDEKIAELEAKVSELEDLIKEKDAKIAELEGKGETTEEPAAVAASRQARPQQMGKLKFNQFC